MKYRDNNIVIRRLDDRQNYLNGQTDTLFISSYGNLLYPYLKDNGGVSSEISLTIDSFKKKPNIVPENNSPNEKWIDNGKRLLDKVIEDELHWGFKETSLEPTFMSNAFCFANQKLNVYIAPQGHLAGYVDNKWVYTRTKMSIKLTDIINGTQTTIKSFQSFELGADAPDRYFEVGIPNINQDAFNRHGVFGIVVLTAEISFDFYEDAEMEKRVVIPLNSKKEFHLQILVFSPSVEASTVTDPMGIFTETINGDEDFSELFEKSVFVNHDGVNCLPLSDEQKRAVIADQIAAIFMSQHPVITSDYYPMKLLGYGVSQTSKPRHIVNKASIYSQKYPDVIPMVNDRLYGMLLRYKTFGFCTEIDKHFNDIHQSTQKLIDPVRIIAVNEDGKVDFEFGNEGVLFNPFAVESINVEIPKHISSNEFVISKNNKTVPISTISITNPNGSQITTSTRKVKVSFSITDNQNIIDSIEYSIWTSNNLGWYKYSTKSVETSYVFDLDSENQIQINGSSPVTLGDIVKARIDITDINGVINSFYQDCFVPLASNKPSIMNLVGLQANDGSGFVDVYYTYVGASEINNTNMSMSYSYDKQLWSIISEDIAGDIGNNVMPGHKKIKWYPWNTISGDTEFLFVKISLLDADSNVSISKINETAIQVGNQKPKVALRRLNDDEIQDMYYSSSSSSSSSSSTSSSSTSSSSSLGESSSSSSKSSSSSSSSSKSSISSQSTSSSSSSSSSTEVRSTSSSSSEMYSESSDSSSTNSSSSSSEMYSESSTSSSMDIVGVTITDISGDMPLWKNVQNVTSASPSSCEQLAGNSMYIGSDLSIGTMSDTVFTGWSFATNQLVVAKILNPSPYTYGLIINVDRSSGNGATRNIKITSQIPVANVSFVSTNPAGMSWSHVLSNGNKQLDIQYGADHYPQILKVYFNQ